MISTDITGGSVGGANQLLDLLSLVANPTVYEAKVKALQDAIAEHRKYVEAVAPVSEIAALRAQMVSDREATKQALFDATTEAGQIKADALAEAASIKAAATAAAKKTTEAAKAKLESASAAELAAVTAHAQVQEVEKSLAAERALVNAKKAELAEALETAEALKAEYAGLRTALIEKHQAIIAGL